MLHASNLYISLKSYAQKKSILVYCFNFVFQGVRVPEVITIRLAIPMGHLQTRYGNDAM